MTEIDDYIQRLLDADPIREPVLRSILQSIGLPPGSRGLDVGCGIGLQELLLARALGAGGHVTGTDILPEFLAYGGELARKAGLGGQIDFREGDMNHLPFPDNSFDWAWSADCIGYPAGDLLPLLHELMRVVKPGGSLHILAWTSQQVLPGHPRLEAWLNANCSSYAPFLQGKDPGQHFLQALRWFREAGLEEAEAKTFVGEVQAPLKPDECTALLALFEMLWAPPAAGENAPEWKEFQRLCARASPDLILNEPGYYAFFTYTLFRGRVRSP